MKIDARIISCRWISMKNILRVDPGNQNRLENCWITVERSKMTSISIHIIANQSSYHDDKSTLQCFTCVYCPQLIRNVRSRRRIDISSVIAHPVNSNLHTWERSLKFYAKNSTYIYICIYIYVYIYKYLCVCDALDNRCGFLYQFNMGLIASLFIVSFHEKFEKNVFLKFSQVGRSVIGWRSG